MAAGGPPQSPPPGGPPAGAPPPGGAPPLGTQPGKPVDPQAAPPAGAPPPAAPPEPEPEDEPTRMVRLAVSEKRARARRAQQAILVVARPGVPPAPLTLNRPRTLIGRDRDTCDVVLEDEGVSRQHASVTKEATGFYVLHDLGSRNGITVNGQKVTRRTLISGDSFALGGTTITFQSVAVEGEGKK